MKEQINALNQILGIIDQKAARYMDERFDMKGAQAAAEKKMLLDLIADALSLAGKILPKPIEAIDDLKRLEKRLMNLP